MCTLLTSKKILHTRKDREVFVIRFKAAGEYRSLFYPTYWKLGEEKKESFRSEAFAEGLELRNSKLKGFKKIEWVIGGDCFHTFTTLKAALNYIKAGQMRLIGSNPEAVQGYVICKAIISANSKYLHGRVEVRKMRLDDKGNFINKGNVYCPAIVTEKLKLIEVLDCTD